MAYQGGFMSMEIHDLLAWALVPIGLIRYQIRSTRWFLGVNGGIGFWVAAIYAMEGGWSGASVAVASGSATLAQCLVGHQLSLGSRLLIAAPAIVVAILLKEAAWYAFLPLAAFTAARIAEAVRHDLGLRVTLLGSSTLWVLYGILLGVPQIVVFEALGILSNMMGIWRMHGGSAHLMDSDRKGR